MSNGLTAQLAEAYTVAGNANDRVTEHNIGNLPQSTPAYIPQ